MERSEEQWSISSCGAPVKYCFHMHMISLFKKTTLKIKVASQELRWDTKQGWFNRHHQLRNNIIDSGLACTNVAREGAWWNRALVL